MQMSSRQCGPLSRAACWLWLLRVLHDQLTLEDLMQAQVGIMGTPACSIVRCLCCLPCCTPGLMLRPDVQGSLPPPCGCARSLTRTLSRMPPSALPSATSH